MALSFPLTLPATPGLTDIEISPLNAAAMLQSGHSFKQQVQRFGGQLWRADVTLPLMNRAQAAPWVALKVALSDRVGTVLIGDPDATTPLGVATGTPLVDGAGQAGATLATKGWTASVTGILKAGDYLQIGSGAAQRLHQVLQDTNSDGAGLASVDIWPDLRESPADASAIATASTSSAFRLLASGGWRTDRRGLFSLDFSFIEALDG